MPGRFSRGQVCLWYWWRCCDLLVELKCFYQVLYLYRLAREFLSNTGRFFGIGGGLLGHLVQLLDRQVQLSDAILLALRGRGNLTCGSRHVMHLRDDFLKVL